ncbi:MAG: GNAT family N-acetyltransferase [Bacteroidales bacterium]|nr:GNAT family N-acetyltransferase [Bacteroidales bacterium]
MAESIHLYKDRPVEQNLIRNSWEAAFGREMPDGYWDWWFRGNPFDAEPKIAYIMCDGVVAAYYAVTPLLARLLDDTIERCGLMNMGFTHPDYQGRGYYLIINRLLHDSLKDEKYSFLFGFANHNSHYPYRRHLGWNDLAVQNIFCRGLKEIRKVSDEKCSITFSLSGLDAKAIEFMSGSKTCERGVCIVRSREYLEWRLLNHPVNRYECCEARINGKTAAILVYKKYRNTHIDAIEFFYSPEFTQVKDSLLVQSLDFLQHNTARDANIWSGLYTDEHLLLEKHGFVESGFSAYFGMIGLKSRPELMDIRNWHYRLIDSDVF